MSLWDNSGARNERDDYADHLRDGRLRMAQIMTDIEEAEALAA